jgi:predicted RNase H-like HicB family nuclease
VTPAILRDAWDAPEPPITSRIFGLAAVGEGGYIERSAKGLLEFLIADSPNQDEDECRRHACYNTHSETRTMTYEFSVVIERDEDGYFVASVPALRGCHTQAKSLDVLMKRIREAILLCLEVEEPISNEFVGVQRVAITA